MTSIMRSLVLFLVAVGVTAANAQGPGPTPDPWYWNYPAISYDQGGATLPSTVTGGQKGIGTVNVSGGFYVNGTLIGTGSSISVNPPLNNSGGTISLNYGGAFALSSGTLESVLPVQTIAGASHVFGSADIYLETRRSNSGSAMTDTFPASSTTGLVNGTRIQLNNVDASASDTISAGSGTSISGSGVIGPGRSSEWVYDGPNTTWRPTMNSLSALLAADNLSELTSPSTARTNLGLGALAVLGAGTGLSVSGSNLTLASIGANTVLGSIAGGTPGALTTTQLTTLCNTATSSLSGCVPASGGGTTNFLRGDFTWATPPGATFANPTGTIGLTAVNGSATTAMRSDAAPAFSQALTPTNTGLWQFGAGFNLTGGAVNFTLAASTFPTLQMGTDWTPGLITAFSQCLFTVQCITAESNTSAFQAYGLSIAVETVNHNGAPALATYFVGYANNATTPSGAWANYSECHRMTSADYCIDNETAEVDRINSGSAINPYGGTNGSVNTQLDCGDSYTSFNYYQCSGALSIVQNAGSGNTSPFAAGIVFQVNSILNSSSPGAAIEFPNNDGLVWFEANNVKAWQIYANTDGSVVNGQNFIDLEDNIFLVNVQDIVQSALNASASAADFCYGATGDRSCSLNFGASSTGGGGDFNIQRQAGANGSVVLSNNGTGNIAFNTQTITTLLLSTGFMSLNQASPGAGNTLEIDTLAGEFGPGTISVSGTTTTGSSTTFTQSFQNGDTITSGADSATVVAIASNTSMTTTAWAPGSPAGGSSYTISGGDRLLVQQNGSMVVGGGPNIGTGSPRLVYASRTYSNVGGTNSMTDLTAASTAVETTAAFAGAIVGLQASPAIGATNTQNWTKATAQGGLVGIFAGPNILSGASGTVAEETGLWAQIGNSSASVTLTNAYEIQAGGLFNTGTITNAAGVTIVAMSLAANNTHLLIGTATIPSGNWGIYDASTDANLISGTIDVPGLPTSAGSGGIYVCVDTSGNLYKKSSCP